MRPGRLNVAYDQLGPSQAQFRCSSAHPKPVQGAIFNLSLIISGEECSGIGYRPENTRDVGSTAGASYGRGLLRTYLRIEYQHQAGEHDIRDALSQEVEASDAYREQIRLQEAQVRCRRKYHGENFRIEECNFWSPMRLILTPEGRRCSHGRKSASALYSSLASM